MTLFTFHVAMHSHKPGDVVDVVPQDRAAVQPLIDAGYLVPLYPEREDFPVPKRRRARAAPPSDAGG